MDLILKIRKEEIGLINDGVSTYLNRGPYGESIFSRASILDTNPTGQRTVEKSKVVFLGMSSLYQLAMSHYTLSCGNDKWLDRSCDPSFPDIATVEENEPQR